MERHDKVFIETNTDGDEQERIRTIDILGLQPMQAAVAIDALRSKRNELELASSDFITKNILDNMIRAMEAPVVEQLKVS